LTKISHLPTKDNLFHTGIIPLGSESCVGGCGDLETVYHLFLEVSLLWFVMTSCSKVDWFFFHWSFCYFGSIYTIW